MNAPRIRAAGFAAAVLFATCGPWACSSNGGGSGAPLPAGDVTFGTGCQIAANCPQEYPHCDPQTGTCAACLSGAHCEGDLVCVAGMCSDAGACEPGSAMCNGNELWTCHADGGGYDTLACPAVCADGECRLCVPETLRCQTFDVEVCSGDGFAWTWLVTCSDYCLSGTCLTCIPGDTRCVENVLEACDATGTTWEASKDCGDQGDGLVCLAGQCIDPCSDDFKFNTNMGCEYWAVDLDQTNENEGHNSPFAIVVSNVGTKTAAVVTLSRNGVKEDEATVEPEGLHIFEVAPHNVDGTMKAQRAFRLKSTQPIIAYQFNPLENVGVYSNDASMLIPRNSLGTTYRVLGWPERTGQLRSYVTIVGVKSGTEVEVVSTAHTGGGGEVPALVPGQTYKTTLEPFEVLSIETAGVEEDLTGTLITATKQVAVFSGSECANVPYASGCGGGSCDSAPLWSCGDPTDCPVICCCDHLEEQLIPVSAWGKTYVGARSQERGAESDWWRVVASEDLTTVYLNPPVAGVPTLQAGDVFEFPAVDAFVLTATKPVLLGQFLASEHAPGAFVGICEGGGFLGTCSHTGMPCLSTNDCSDELQSTDAQIGDPAFIIGVPVEQLRDDYIFLVPNKYQDDYLTIYAQQGTEISLDGASLNPGSFQMISGTWRILHKKVADGVHRMTGSAPFGVMVHGYDSYVSYGYPAGMNVTSLQGLGQ